MTRREIDALFRRYGPMVYRRALAILGNEADAQEASQEVFIRALRSGDGFQRRSQVSTWLYRITTNFCLNKIRDAKRRRELWDEKQGADPSPRSNNPDPARALALRRLLAEADEEQAQAAVYVYVDGMSHQEASKLLGVSRRTVGNLLERFTTWARQRLEEVQDAESPP